jgi:epoxyqueuosine reductase
VIDALLTPHKLTILGAFHAEAADDLPAGTQTLLMIGPAEGFWPHMTAQPEWGATDPVDRWSRRVIGTIACNLGAKALFPFGGPPYSPFQRWALRTGRMWQSPVRLLVHDVQGLWVSFRGALALKERIDLPDAPPRPCDTCSAPCLTACPVGALTDAGYDVPACHQFLNTEAGQTCMTDGCIVRRTCPVSQGYARISKQSAYHMRQFHK